MYKPAYTFFFGEFYQLMQEFEDKMASVTEFYIKANAIHDKHDCEICRFLND